jgi:4'-phosphopantetheinyl transferase
MGERVRRRAGTDPVKGEVHVWLGRVPDRRPAPGNLGSLSIDEIERAGRLRFEHDRTRQLWGRILVRQLLSRYTGLAPASIEISRRCRLCGHPDHGKPYLAGRPPIGFSVSRSAGLVALAVASGAAVGIDIETRQLDWREVAFVLTPAERDFLARLPDRDQPRAFVQIWTRKEACLKADGAGLARGGLDSLDTAWAGGAGWANPGEPDGMRPHWWVRDLPFDAVGAGAVATPRPMTLRTFRLEVALPARSGGQDG